VYMGVLKGVMLLVPVLVDSNIKRCFTFLGLDLPRYMYMYIYVRVDTDYYKTGAVSSALDSNIKRCFTTYACTCTCRLTTVSSALVDLEIIYRSTGRYGRRVRSTGRYNIVPSMTVPVAKSTVCSS